MTQGRQDVTAQVYDRAMRVFIYHSLQGIALSDKEEISPGPANGRWVWVPVNLVRRYRHAEDEYAAVQARLVAIMSEESQDPEPPSCTEVPVSTCEIGVEEPLGGCPGPSCTRTAAVLVRLFYHGEPAGKQRRACDLHAGKLMDLIGNLSDPAFNWSVERIPLGSDHE